MALPVGLIPSKEEIIKERERERLHRYLFIKFGRKKFDMFWTDYETSYTDYTSIYVKYNLQTPDHQHFTIEELRMLRKGHALHERGHIEYDISGVTYNWRKALSSEDKKDWEANLKYPMGWLNYFSGIMVDVRMENFVIIDLPEAKQYFDFCNYNWRFGIRGQNAGEDRLYDFRECLASRGFNLKDIPGWHPEAVQLVDSVTNLINDVQFSRSTEEGMENTTRIVKEVWPTLFEWMVSDGQLDNDPEENESNHVHSNWGNQDDVKENTDRVVVKIQLAKKTEEENNENKTSKETNEDDSNNANLREEVDEPDYKAVLKSIASELENDKQTAEAEVDPYKSKLIEVTVDEERKDRKAYSEQIVLTPYYEHDLASYQNIKMKIERQIQPTAAALKRLLEPIPDQMYTNQRSGRLNVTKVWSASIMDDPNVFNRLVKGSPAQDARILVLDDVSGSTGASLSPGVRRIDEMKKAMVLLSEATEVAKIPTAMYAFTESSYTESEGNISYPITAGYDEQKTIGFGTVIFPLKPFGKLTNVDKGFIGALSPQSGNRDTLALQWAVNELSKFNEKNRLLLVLSDGEPCFQENEDEDTMRAIVQQARKQGIDVLCLFIGPEYSFDAVKHMYPGGAIFVTKNLVRDLTQQIMQILNKRRK